MSKGAVEILKKEGINYEYKTLTEFIENRKKTGICPMDEAVQNITNAKDACEAIRQKMKFLQRMNYTITKEVKYMNEFINIKKRIRLISRDS